MSSAEYTTFCPDAKAGEEFEFRSLRKDNKNVSDEQKYAFFIPPRYAFIPIYTFLYRIQTDLTGSISVSGKLFVILNHGESSPGQL